jgi:glycosyltransferase involved in cell wall biosynthesis
MEELISIVLPVCNGERYLRESIDSVLNQTYRNWELIIVDDCSTDSSAKIAREYTKKDKRIYYYRNENNLRLPRNLNKGFKLARGNYLTWTSDDNRFKSTALEKMYSALKNDIDAQFVFASCRVINSEGSPIEYIMVDNKRKKQIVGHNVVGACFMYTRKAYEEVGEYNPEFVLVEDYDYWQRMYTKFNAVVISEILYEYRWHDGALTSTMKKEAFNRTLEKMLLKNRPLFGEIDAESNYYYYQGLYYCKKNVDDKNNPYWFKYKWYSFIYLFEHKIPEKIKRIIRNV